MSRTGGLVDRLFRAGRAFEDRELRIPARLSMLSDARDWASRAAADFGFEEEERFQVRLATSEAVTNAIVHGSTSGADAVELGAREEKGALVFEVRDAGASAGLPGHVQPLEEGGRGLELVGMIMDEVAFERRGHRGVLRYAKRLAA